MNRSNEIGATARERGFVVGWIGLGVEAELERGGGRYFLVVR